jgi:hypothetical protein
MGVRINVDVNMEVREKEKEREPYRVDPNVGAKLLPYCVETAEPRYSSNDMGRQFCIRCLLEPGHIARINVSSSQRVHESRGKLGLRAVIPAVAKKPSDANNWRDKAARCHLVGKRA